MGTLRKSEWFKQAYALNTLAWNKKIMEAQGLEGNSKAAAGPSVKGKTGEEEWGMEELSGEEASQFRSQAASLNYLGQDRCDIQYAVKELCQGMARPTVAGQVKIKRVARYLVGARRRMRLRERRR